MTIPVFFKWLLVIGSYLLGTLPFQWRVTDHLRGQAAATPLQRRALKGGALLLDAAKGAIAVGLVLAALALESSLEMPRWVGGALLAAVLGDLRPPWSEVPPGLGIATALGGIAVVSTSAALIGLLASLTASVAVHLYQHLARRSFVKPMAWESKLGSAAAAFALTVQLGYASPLVWAAVAVTILVNLRFTLLTVG